MLLASETNSAMVCLSSLRASATISRTFFWFSAFLARSTMKLRSILSSAGSKWLSIWNELRLVPNCSRQIRQPKLATIFWNACSARRWVKIFDSGNCSTRCAPETECAFNCEPMKLCRSPSASDEGATLTNRVVSLPAFLRSANSMIVRPMTQRSSSIKQAVLLGDRHELVG